MAYTTEDLERMKISLGITDCYPVENVILEFLGLSIQVYRNRIFIGIDESPCVYHAAKSDGTYITHQRNISELVSSCLDNFGPVAIYTNDVPEDEYIRSPYDDCIPLTPEEWGEFNYEFNMRKEKYIK